MRVEIVALVIAELGEFRVIGVIQVAHARFQRKLTLGAYRAVGPRPAQ